MEKNLKQIVLLVGKNPDLKGSLIEEILQTMLSGKFTDVENDVESSEKVIGEMNTLEKVLVTLRDRHARAELSLVNRFREAELFTGKEIDPEEKKRMEKDLRKSRERFKVVQDSLWANINDRFGHLDEPESTGFGLRSGYKVTLRYGRKSDLNLLEMLLAFGTLKRMERIMG